MQPKKNNQDYTAKSVNPLGLILICSEVHLLAKNKVFNLL